MLLEGWATTDRLLLLHLVRAVDGQLAKDRVDRAPSYPGLIRARGEMAIYLKRGGTSATHGSALNGSQTALPTAPFAMLSVSTASAALGIGETAVRRQCRRGTLAGIKVRGEWCIDSESVAARRRQKERQPL